MIRVEVLLRVVGAGEGRSNLALGVGLHDHDNRAVCTGDEDEQRNDDAGVDAEGLEHRVGTVGLGCCPAVEEPAALGEGLRLVGVRLALLDVHVKRQAGWHDDDEGWHKEGTHETQEVTEEGNRTGDDETEDENKDKRTEPDRPVSEGVPLQVPGVAEQSHECVLGRQVSLEEAGEEQGWDADCVSDNLDGWTSTAQSRGGDVGADLSVHDE